MGRRIVAGGLVVVVPVATLLALFVHTHPDDHETEHHAARAIHAHFRGHAHADRQSPADGPVITGDDDDRDRAVYLGAYLGEAIAPLNIVAVVPQGIHVAVPPARRARLPLQVVHGHDPPALASLPARAPPNLPVLI